MVVLMKPWAHIQCDTEEFHATGLAVIFLLVLKLCVIPIEPFGVYPYKPRMNRHYNANGSIKELSQQSLYFFYFKYLRLYLLANVIRAWRPV